MIKQNTLVILGAGASIPYGYPSGIELLDDICKANDANEPAFQLIIKFIEHENDIRFSHILSHNNVKLATVPEFVSKLQYAYPPTIDYFLNQYKDNDEYIKFGKLRIANIILKREQEFRKAMLLPREIIFNSSHADAKVRVQQRESQKWYGLFFNDILREKNFDDLFKNQINIVNFNYDRSFECFVYNHLKYTYNASDHGIFKFFKHINYKHVYGVVAPIYLYNGVAQYDFKLDVTDPNNLDFVFNSDKPSPFAYGMINDATFKDISKDIVDIIKVIDVDRQGEDGGEEPIIDYLNLVKKICFLGFGYDKTNMDLLRLQEFQGEQVEGTVRGIALQRIRELKKYFSGKTEYYERIDDTNKHEYLRDQDIVSYLKYYANLH